MTTAQDWATKFQASIPFYRVKSVMSEQIHILIEKLISGEFV